MHHLTIQEVSAFLEAATIEQTIDEGHAIIHTGTTQSGERFVLVNNLQGETVLTVA